MERPRGIGLTPINITELVPVAQIAVEAVRVIGTDLTPFDQLITTANPGFTCVGCTLIYVVAVKRRPAIAGATATGVGACANLSVIARITVVRIHAAAARVARVIRADVLVIAVARTAGATRAPAAGITLSAGVPIITGKRIVRCHAAIC